MSPTRNASSNNTKIAPVIHFSTRFNTFITHPFTFNPTDSVDRSFLASFLFLVCCIRGTCAAWFLRQKSELLHQRKLIKGRPLLFDLAVHDPPDRDPGLFRFLSRGG